MDVTLNRLGNEGSFKARYYGDSKKKELENEAQVDAVINKSQQGYSHIESGRAELKIDDLILLCRFYGVSADYLVGLKDRKSED